MKRLLTGVLVILIASITHPVFGGDLDPPGDPSAGSGMPTLEQIYNYLNFGEIPEIQENFQEPSAGPAPTMKTTQEICDVINEKFESLRKGEETAKAKDVLGGKPFFDTEVWGINEGSMADHGGMDYTPRPADQAVAEGYYDGSGKVKGDADLVPENIKCGKTIFGVTGTLRPGCVAKTGQITCYNASGGVIDCTGTGQDGEYQMGCDPVVPSGGPNFGNYNRTSIPCLSAGFTDNGDGTVTDNLTGLIWLKDAYCDGEKTWTNALSFCNGLSNGSCGLTDGSEAGDWRLPNINELRSLFDPTLGSPYLPEGHPFSDVQSTYFYWSSTTSANDTSKAWYVHLFHGFVYYDDKTLNTGYVWPVRGGQ